MMGQMKELMKLQQQAKEIQKKLENIHIEAEVDGVTVIIDAAMNVQEVRLSDEAKNGSKQTLEVSIKEAMQKGMRKAQQVAAENMKGVMGSLGLPGMPS